MGKGSMIFGVKPIRQQYVNPIGACFYTRKTPDQLDHAVRKGHLRYALAKDGTRSFCIDDLDEFMDAIQNPPEQNPSLNK
jgi:hypothetical protein